MEFREEMVQVAAVAVSIIEDMIYGEAGLSDSCTDDVLENIKAERAAQDLKWGPQHHTPEMWLAILMEEVGEAAQAYLHEVEAGWTP